VPFPALSLTLILSGIARNGCLQRYWVRSSTLQCVPLRLGYSCLPHTWKKGMAASKACASKRSMACAHSSSLGKCKATIQCTVHCETQKWGQRHSLLAGKGTRTRVCMSQRGIWRLATLYEAPMYAGTQRMA